jgi:hypothetical protein
LAIRGAKHRQNKEANIDTIDGESDNNNEKDTDINKDSEQEDADNF